MSDKEVNGPDSTYRGEQQPHKVTSVVANTERKVSHQDQQINNQEEEYNYDTENYDWVLPVVSKFIERDRQKTLAIIQAATGPVLKNTHAWNDADTKKVDTGHIHKRLRRKKGSRQLRDLAAGTGIDSTESRHTPADEARNIDAPQNLRSTPEKRSDSQKTVDPPTKPLKDLTR